MAGEKRSRATPAAAKPKAKKQKKTPKQSAQSQAERLAADMLDWDTCSGKGAESVAAMAFPLRLHLEPPPPMSSNASAENELFVDEEPDDWRYEDISDSDFDG
ncbi:unnamed protein product [Phytophthora fragariaefolia]|uniref:Unnamed protein product n=1 Tax=Phytophthora fragariaefolia TaxID=1490495 RepID=A0A9W6XIR9_9STRA|nr:unnamed protein product [Phytophthora fragariaefolia]